MKKQLLKKTILVGVISTLIALSSISAFVINKSPVTRLLIRDAVVASVAQYNIGEEALLNLDYTEFVLDYSQIIVPFFENKNIREIPVYPEGITVETISGQGSTGIVGAAYYEEKLIFIFLNEQIDTRYLLPVLVHELVHLQGGQFIDSVPPWLKIIIFEANTQAATVEVLAAMCHSGDDFACDAFWSAIRDHSSSAFWVRLYQVGLEKRYQPIASLFWSDGIDFQKTTSKFIHTYLQYPWDQIIVPGVMGKSLDTGNFYEYELSDGNFVCRQLLMPFDDTERLLGWLDQFIEWITPD